MPSISPQPSFNEKDFNQFLQPCQWRGLGFPIALTGESGAQSLAVHLKMDRDGSQVESTGRRSDVFNVRGYFFNDLFPGPNENWQNSQLFPNQWLLVRDALRDRTTGTFNHPLYGAIQCKPVSWKMTVDADHRRGVIVDMEFQETIDDQGLVVQQTSAISAGRSSAAVLDTWMLNTFGLNSFVPSGIGSFTNWMFSITSFFNQASQFGNHIVNQFNQMVGSLTSLIDQMNADLDINQSNVAATGFYNIIDAAQNLLASIYLLRAQLSSVQTNTNILYINNPTTISSIIIQTQNKLEDLLVLNPSLATSPFVSAGTNITYYTTSPTPSQ